MASKKSKKKKLLYTSWQQHFTSLIQRRFDYVFILHNFQEVVKDSEILGAMSTDHSTLFCSFQRFNKLKRGSGLRKFNNSLISNKYFIQKCTKHIQNVKEQLNSQTQFVTKQNGKYRNMKSAFLILKFHKILHN